LWLTGKIVPAGRDGGGRRWAEADRWFGATIGDVPPPRDAVRTAAIRSLRALGIATKNQVRAHFLRGRYAGLDGAWAHLVAVGVIVPVTIGIKGDWFVHAEDIPLLDRIEAGDFAPRTTLLSPFDNLICHRSRTQALWDFEFRLEIYVPRSTLGILRHAAPPRRPPDRPVRSRGGSCCRTSRRRPHPLGAGLGGSAAASTRCGARPRGPREVYQREAGKCPN
jgi:hypothetical protein